MRAEETWWPEHDEDERFFSWSPDGIQCSSGLAKYFVMLKGLYGEAELSFINFIG